LHSFTSFPFPDLSPLPSFLRNNATAFLPQAPLNSIPFQTRLSPFPVFTPFSLGSLRVPSQCFFFYCPEFWFACAFTFPALPFPVRHLSPTGVSARSPPCSPGLLPQHFCPPFSRRPVHIRRLPPFVYPRAAQCSFSPPISFRFPPRGCGLIFSFGPTSREFVCAPFLLWYFFVILLPFPRPARPGFLLCLKKNALAPLPPSSFSLGVGRRVLFLSVFLGFSPRLVSPPGLKTFSFCFAFPPPPFLFLPPSPTVAVLIFLYVEAVFFFDFCFSFFLYFLADASPQLKFSWDLHWFFFARFPPLFSPGVGRCVCFVPAGFVHNPFFSRSPSGCFFSLVSFCNYPPFLVVLKHPFFFLKLLSLSTLGSCTVFFLYCRSFDFFLNLPCFPLSFGVFLCWL